MRRTVATKVEPDAAASGRPLPDDRLKEILYFL